MAMFDRQKSSKEKPGKSPRGAGDPRTAGSASKAGGERSRAVIGNGVEIAGDVRADANLRIEGTVEGNGIESSHDVQIDEPGKVKADITAKVVTVAGKVTGDIRGTEKVLITHTGRVQGNIVAPRVQLEDGALFRGSIEMNPTDTAEAEKTPERPAAEGAVPLAGGRPRAADDSGDAAAGGSDGTRESGLNLKSG